ncbi:DNA replication ATPase [Ophiocordyceps camponoti-floridani]|uniref:DNA replication ATPase n=1 Tax=Ophiocordyceps camponoti-floridani TaxID=2030778 RepID=A0A8H4VDG4_9HYPO|nr:DNA replication ATPase [Ophiocordyceps camponoti-floridani]
MAVACPICAKPVRSSQINAHIDSGCSSFVAEPSPPQSQADGAQQKRGAADFFSVPSAKRTRVSTVTTTTVAGTKRSFDEGPGDANMGAAAPVNEAIQESAKRIRTQQRLAPLAERMRPQTLDDVYGQELVSQDGALRALLQAGNLPSLILWGGPGTGKTTIARCVARAVGGRFVELNATSSGVSECRKLFVEAASELTLTGRRTIVFCDELHRFSRAQQDVFLQPVEAGTVTLIGATTENPSFKIGAALLSRCRTLTLAPLAREAVVSILRRACDAEKVDGMRVDDDMLGYLAGFSDGDARVALNLLELTLSLPPGSTKEDVKAALTHTLIYDRSGDQHYDAISAFHKSVRGNDAHAALYYLARMLQSGEDPLFIARRMVVIASEDIGLADSTCLPLATAAYTATQQIGMPEARIPLAHVAVALSLAPKSTRAYRGLNNAMAALKEPGVAALPVPLHLRNAPTRLLREMGVAADYKYPPNYRGGRVRQEYLPVDPVD